MIKKRITTIIVMVCIFFLAGINVFGENTNKKMFNYHSKYFQNGSTKTLQNRLKKIKSRKTVENSYLSELNLATMLTQDSILLNIPDNDEEYLLVKDDAKHPKNGKIHWIGSIFLDDNKIGGALFIINNNKVRGTINIREKQYSVEYLNNVYHIVSERNFSKLPPDHPTY